MSGNFCNERHYEIRISKFKPLDRLILVIYDFAQDWRYILPSIMRWIDEQWDVAGIEFKLLQSVHELRHRAGSTNRKLCNQVISTMIQRLNDLNFSLYGHECVVEAGISSPFQRSLPQW